MYIKVKAKPSSKKESFEMEKENVFCVKIKEPARKNLANKRICELVAAHFKVPKGKVKIVSGHHHPTKLLSIDAED